VRYSLPTDPDEPDSSIRLVPWVFDGEALLGPGMKDARRGKPVVGQFRHPIPREAVLLAAPPEGSTPEVGHVMPERRERREMACNDLLQPVTLIWDSLVHSQPQRRLDFLELRLHAVAPMGCSTSCGLGRPAKSTMPARSRLR
jgi:hypothetical protein